MSTLLPDWKILEILLPYLQETVGTFAGCNPEDPPNDGDTTIEFLTEDCLGLILDMVRNNFVLRIFLRFHIQMEESTSNCTNKEAL
jgi:hypothetical protein